MDELQKQLQDVENAIQAVLYGGQSYKLGSRMVQRADLNQLRQMRKDLQAQINSGGNESFFSNTYVAEFDGR